MELNKIKRKGFGAEFYTDYVIIFNIEDNKTNDFIIVDFDKVKDFSNFWREVKKEVKRRNR